jgi:uncharacterized membrane protein YqaE (UPF0057 family)
MKMDWARVIAAIFLPPLAVAWQDGIGHHFIINIVLWILLPWVGGLIHALWRIFRTDD